MATTLTLSREDMMTRLQMELDAPPFHSVLGPQAYDVDPETGLVVVSLPWQDTFSMSADYAAYHGGVIASLIDMAGHAAIAMHTGGTSPTIDLRVDYLRPAPGVTLYAHAVALRVGRAIGRADVTIYANDQVVAVGRGAFSTQA